MKLTRLCLLAAIVVSTSMPTTAWENPAGQEFTATAVMDTGEGTRRMPVTLVAMRYTSMEDAVRLEKVLANGGQGALLASLRGLNDGQFVLGALAMPVSLVTAEEIRDGHRYFFVTGRRIQVEERTNSSESLEYPFGVAIFELGDFGSGEGEIYPAAALRIDPDDGGVVIDEYDGEPGRLIDVQQTR